MPVKLTNRTYQTGSGSLYELSGDPDPAYVAYPQDIGRGLDLEDQGAVICKNDLLQRWAQW